MKNLVHLKVINADSWSGFHRFPKCKDSVNVSLTREGYVTGLTKEVAEKLEKALHKEPGTFSPHSPFWKEYVIWIDQNGLSLDLEKPQDYLDYHILISCERIALGKADRRNKPLAEYLLVDTNEEAKRENKKVKTKKEVSKKFNKMTVYDMKKVLKLLGAKADNAMDEAVENALSTLIEKDPQRVLDVIGVKDFDLRCDIDDMLSLNILRKQGSKYLYADDVIGYSMQETIDYLKDPKNQEIMKVLKDKLAVG